MHEGLRIRVGNRRLRLCDELLRGVGAARHIGTLGDLPVLAERAMEIAARESRRKDLRTGPEMVEGLFLNGIHRKAGNEPVKRNVRLPFRVIPYTAATRFTGSENTAPWTEAAFNLPFRQRSEEAWVTHVDAKRGPDGPKKDRRRLRFL